MRTRSIALIVAAVFPAVAAAQDVEPAKATTTSLLSGIKITTEYSIGVMHSRAQEYLYLPDGKVVSRLNWDGNISMFNARSTVRLTPWLAAGIRGAMNLSSDARMQDVDFNVGGCPATGSGTYCESNSGVQVRRAYMVDGFIAARLYEAAGFSFSAVAGYQHDHSRWEAIGGGANYGDLPPGQLVSYQQTWSAPYIGGSIGYSRGAWSATGRLVGSNWAHGATRDQHHVRSLRFTTDITSTTYASGELGLAYRFNPFFSVTADYRYQQWGLGRGDAKVRDLITGDSATYTNAAGANNMSHTVSLGVKVDLQPAAARGNEAGLKDETASARPAVWRGWYLGANTGAAIQRDRWSTGMLGSPPIAPEPSTATADIFGGTNQRGALFAGYNTRTTIGMLGVETEFGRSNMSVTKSGIPGTGTRSDLAAASDAINVNHDLDASVRLRYGGSLTEAVLVYVTGGVAFERVNASVSCSPGYSACGGAALYDTSSQWRAGWTVGGGAELAIARHWFARTEYRYTDLGAFHHTFFARDPAMQVPVRIDGSNHRLDVGLGTRF